MMAELNLEIIAPSKSFFKGEIKSITVPGTKGRFQVLRNHAPIISTLEVGTVKVDLPDNKSKYYAAAGGTIEVLDNKVLVLVDSIEAVEDIDVDRAEKAKQRAEERLGNKAIENINVARAESALARSINRLKVHEKYLS
jgi:F-type H+-transporting ATPase subunit epsilon